MLEQETKGRGQTWGQSPLNVGTETSHEDPPPVKRAIGAHQRNNWVETKLLESV